MKTPLEIFKLMYDHDPFSKLLDMQLVSINEGYCSLKMCVKPTMLNGFAIAHGGISYSLADSTLAFASNSRGIQSVSIETSISHLAKVYAGDELISQSEEINWNTKTGLYMIKIINQEQKTIALFKGTVYRTGKEW